MDVLCIGEALVDFLPERPGQRVREVERWTRCVGGSPANIAVGLARLGAKSALLGVTGEDEFGHFLKDALRAEGVDVSHLRQTSEGKTGLVFISLTESGERSFSFHRTRAAEQFLGEQDVDTAYAASARLVHFGTNSLLQPDARAAALRMLGAARQAGKIIGCDPNLRLHMWPDPRILKALLDELVPQCALLKLSEEEIEFVTGTADPAQALKALSERGVVLPIVTLAERGALFRWQARDFHVPAPRVPVVDTTGAGDAFGAGLMFGLTRLYESREALLQADAQTLQELVRFGCEVGSRVVQKVGAVAGLPFSEALEGLFPSAFFTTTSNT